MEIKKQLNELKEKVKGIDWKKLIGTKAFVTVGCVMLIGIAVLVSSLVGTSDGNAASGDGDRILGNTILADTSVSVENDSAQSGENVNANPETAEDFFAMAIINRTQVRDSALEVLREIAESPDALPDAKQEALDSITEIADDMTAEANIEALIKAKGIADCVAVISGSNCSVIVNRSPLLPDELTKITDIVYEQTGIPVSNITVVETTAGNE